MRLNAQRIVLDLTIRGENLTAKPRGSKVSWWLGKISMTQAVNELLREELVTLGRNAKGDLEIRVTDAGRSILLLR